MLKDNPHVIPLIAPDGEPAPTQINFSEAEANYLIQILSFYETVIRDVTNKIPPRELLVVLSYLLAVLETQMEHVGDAVTEMRKFFNTIYPAMLANNELQHPEDKDSAFILLVPTAAPGKISLAPFEEKPLIIQPGSTRVN